MGDREKLDLMQSIVAQTYALEWNCDLSSDKPDKISYIAHRTNISKPDLQRFFLFDTLSSGNWTAHAWSSSGTTETTK